MPRVKASCFVFPFCEAKKDISFKKKKKKKQIRHRRIYLSLSLQLRQELLLHACFIIVKRRDEVINDRIHFFTDLQAFRHRQDQHFNDQLIYGDLKE